MKPSNTTSEMQSEPCERTKSTLPERLQALSDADRGLWEALRAVRSTLSKEHKVAAFVIFTNRSLLDMVRQKPESRKQMLLVRGVGQAKLEMFGDIFLDAIRKHRAA